MGEIYDNHGTMIIMSMANLAIDWARKGLDVQSVTRGSGPENTRSMDEAWQHLRWQSMVSVPLQCGKMIGDAYAIKVNNVPNAAVPIEKLTKKECQKILRGV
ncbi:hypothetical protein M409DRAFT_29159 [Zasmidium cellare ATCC 36951]|uniref:Uncharacterized protein n=1 Tax=Zasmidium cellare ATCC 36951 TaxID=1080233 RepID=A0A6A6C011_ZASCE|nr:uncharacterized protein M409DRAFT_29159 [Zasmidium cellare ATCC 36951]KAF2160305.1 hypothetical protein M409DRAFT_29159 [Zasmidium cellare ATCC 36951]